MKNQNTNQNTNQNEKELVSVEIIGLYVAEKISKKGHSYKCIIAVDENDKEHFVCYAK